MKEALLVRRDRGALRSELRRIVEAIIAGEIKTERDLESHKKGLSSRLGLRSIPTNADVLSAALPEERDQLKSLVKRPTRTLSGVAVIAAMTSPARCPHGICVPCPGGLSCSSPQSYTGQEPAAMRAAQHAFDPYDQAHARLQQLEEIGHSVDKAELIIMGGTFTSRPTGYQYWFVKRCLEAMNDYPAYSSRHGEYRPFDKIALANRTARVRNVGTTFETRPDWCTPALVERMLDLGATKVELGVQSTMDEILSRMKRGHTVEDSVRANAVLRNAGLKVGFHMMLGLPCSSPQTDLSSFQELFSDDRFRPDYLKIYPTLVIKGTELHDLYVRGEYLPLCDEEAAELVSKIKALLPRYVRLQRVQRDIPARLIEAGVQKSNLRQIAVERLKGRAESCECIRCREAGLKGVLDADVDLRHEAYRVCGGEEHFLSFEGQDDTLVGFLRLRLMGGDGGWDEDGGESNARVRELHVYGPMVPLGTRKYGWQHKGYGARLVEAAEAIAFDEGYNLLEVTSGIGARGYYERLGYDLRGHYMAKDLGRVVKDSSDQNGRKDQNG